MLVVSHIRDTATNGKDESQGQVEGFRTSVHFGNGELSDFSDGVLLESIDFDDLFLCMDDVDVLPDLEMYPELFPEFSLSPRSGDDSDKDTSLSDGSPRDEVVLIDDDKVSISGSGSGSSSSNGRDEKVGANSRPSIHGDKGRKSFGDHGKNNKQGKRKVKVDWTPELHRRFVQAVEQLGVDKAVPSRILEIMGIDCLTRHNIASHLQKYRSHKKHLLAREAEAASWSQRRQMHGAAVAGGGGGKRNLTPWLAPTMGFPPITPMHPHHHFRPLHVWGHPSMDQPLMHIWPKPLPHSPSPPRLPPPSAWPAPPDPSFWNHHNHQRVPSGILTPGTPCFPQPLSPPTRFAAPGISPHAAMHKVEGGIGVSPSSTAQSVGPHALFDILPSKESIDAAIGDVISKPWLPLPLGLKPPSVDGVLVELQRQGVPKIPPSSSTSCA